MQNCRSPIATKAPNHDLNFWKKFSNYKSINESISNEALRESSKHLWYLSPELSIIELFDDDVSIEVKMKIIQKIKNKISSITASKTTTKDTESLNTVNKAADNDGDIDGDEINNCINRKIFC